MADVDDGQEKSAAPQADDWRDRWALVFGILGFCSSFLVLLAYAVYATWWDFLLPLVCYGSGGLAAALGIAAMALAGTRRPGPLCLGITAVLFGLFSAFFGLLFFAD